MDPQTLWWLIPAILILAAVFVILCWFVGVIFELIWAAGYSLVQWARTGHRS
jgi:hypothetical protein